MAPLPMRGAGFCSACRRAPVWARAPGGNLAAAASSPPPPPPPPPPPLGSGRTTPRSHSTLAATTASSASAAIAFAPPFRMAVVGSGPAGFYTAYRVMSRIAGAKVDMYEALPVPFGLVRFGVAPDHPEVKNCQEKFAEVASSPDFTFIGNVSVGGAGGGEGGEGGGDGSSGGGPPGRRRGGSVRLRSLLRRYDAVVFAYGASRDRRLGVPGEADGLVRGVWSAREFVGWYNGLPGRAGAAGTGLGPGPDLARGDTAVVIGQGNVALDVARILLRDVRALRGTDMAAHAVEALGRSTIRRVRVVGRRGPMQAAFTIKEVRELMRLQDEGVAFEPFPRHLIPPDLSALPRPRRRLMELLAKAAAAPPSRPPHGVALPSKSWSLEFCLAPTRFRGRRPAAGGAGEAAGPFSASGGDLDAVEFARTVLEPSPFDPGARAVVPAAGGKAQGEGNESRLDVMPASLAFRSIGYEAEPLAEFADVGIPFDRRRAVIANDGVGRVLSRLMPQQQQQYHQEQEQEQEQKRDEAAAAALPGLYCAGWVKTGPTGVIAATMADAFATGDAVASDWAAGRPFLRRAGGDHGDGGGWAALRGEVEAEDGGPPPPVVVRWADWLRIDAAERARGAAAGKERQKFTSVSEMLAVLGVQ